MASSTSTVVEGLDRLSTTDSAPTTPTAEKKAMTADAQKPQQQQRDIAGKKILEQIEQKKLRIKAAGQDGGRLKRSLLVLHGQPPRDDPLVLDITSFGQDRRHIQPLTIRYLAKDTETACSRGDWQDRVMEAIWTRLQVISPDTTALPAIIFDEDQETLAPILELTFDSVEQWGAAVEKLQTIEVDHNTKHPLTYEQDVWTNTLPANIFPVDILRLPLEEARRSEFFAALQDLASPVGCVLGAGLIQAATLGSDDTSCGIIRFYIKLSAASMKAPFDKLICALPTKFCWQGEAFKMVYAGYEYQEDEMSVDYPEETRHSAKAEAS